MKERILQSWQRDKKYTLMVGFWLATVVSAFFGSYLLPVSLPVFGTLFAFRFLLPITVVLYFVWAIPRKEKFWNGIPTIEKWCYIFAIALLIYGVLSLFWAMDFQWTFRRLFNLAYDVFFFLMVLRIYHIPEVRNLTVRVCTVMLAALLLLGLYEVFFGGVLDPVYDDYKRVYIFGGIYQFPVVFSGNTNDYASTLLFLLSIFLVWRLQPEKKWSRLAALSVALFAVFTYALVEFSGARLCMVGCLILFIGIFFYFVFGEKKKPGRILVPLFIILGVLGVEFATRYHYLMPRIVAYVQALQQGESASLDIQDPEGESLGDQFFEVDESTGQLVLRAEGSAGIRARLLVHAGECFANSYGLGVGLGNTEMLAKKLEVIPDAKIWSIHCFLARLISDFGVFALIPMGAIVFLILKNLLQKGIQGIRKKNRLQMGYIALLLCILVLYPVVSTASSDAQDLLMMWLYLGVIALSMGTWQGVVNKDIV